MKNAQRTLLAMLAMVLCLARATAQAEELKVTKSIPLPGVNGRFDHAAVDAATHRLFFFAHWGTTLSRSWTCSRASGCTRSPD